MAFAGFALELVNHPLGVAEDELEERLGVGARAIERCLAAWEEYRKDGFPRRVRGKAAHVGEKARPGGSAGQISRGSRRSRMRTTTV